jgi:hypothetical protein
LVRLLLHALVLKPESAKSQPSSEAADDAVSQSRCSGWMACAFSSDDPYGDEIVPHKSDPFGSEKVIVEHFEDLSNW